MSRFGLTISYNGEIYNYKELRSELRRIGYDFESDCDTEVVLGAYAEWGEGCLAKFNGMFAFAIWTARERSLFLARDHLGIKPLYYAVDGDLFLFASEVRALIALGLRYPRVNEESLDWSLHGGLWQPDDGSTAIEGVRSLEPGCFLKLYENARAREQRYWTLPTEISARPAKLETLSEELWHLLDDSVRLRLTSDVPVAALLSGGLDSSSIAWLAASHRPGIAALTIRYGHPYRSRESVRDWLYARVFAECVPVLWVDEVVASDSWCLENIEKTIDLASFCSEPRMLTILQLYKYVRDRCGHVVLNGQGADELMGGYAGTGAADDFLSSIHAGQTEARYSDDSGWFSPQRILGQARAYAAMKGAYDALAGSPEERLHRYQTMFLLRAILRFEDFLSMQNGVECRVPFLDHRIVELCFSVPFAVHVADRQRRGKVLLRQAAQQRVPTRISSRAKQPFAQPNPPAVGTLLRQILKENENAMRRSDLVSAAYDVEEVFGGESQPSVDLLWSLVSLWRWENVFDRAKREARTWMH